MRINVPAKLSNGSDINGFRDPNGNTLYGMACPDKDIIMTGSVSTGNSLISCLEFPYIRPEAPYLNIINDSNCGRGWTSNFEPHTFDIPMGYYNPYTVYDAKLPFKAWGWFFFRDDMQHLVYAQFYNSKFYKTINFFYNDGSSRIDVHLYCKYYTAPANPLNDVKPVYLSEGFYGYYIESIGYSARVIFYNSSGGVAADVSLGNNSSLVIADSSVPSLSVKSNGIIQYANYSDITYDNANRQAIEFAKLSNNINYRKLLWSKALVVGVKSANYPVFGTTDEFIGSNDPKHNYFVGQESFGRCFVSDDDNYIGHIIIFPQFKVGDESATINFTTTNTSTYKVGFIQAFTPSFNGYGPINTIQQIYAFELPLLDLNSSAAKTLTENGESEWDVGKCYCTELGNTAGTHNCVVYTAPSQRGFPYVYLPKGSTLNSIVYS